MKRHYGLITLSCLKKIPKGLINTSYYIEGYRPKNKKVRGCLRIYPVSKKRSQIRFEHDLLKTLERRSFKNAPILIPNTRKETITPITAANPGKNTLQYTALFNYIEGISPYDWNTAFIPLNHIEEAGDLLGRYHNTIKNYHPHLRNEAFQGIVPIQNLGKRLTSPHLKLKSCQDVFYELLYQNHHLLFEHLIRLKTLFTSSRFLSLPRLVIHGDCHPGNLRIFNNRVTALLDFDWSHEDARVIDLALSLTYLAFPYPFDLGKPLSSRAVDAFTSGYLFASKKAKKPLEPISLNECRVMTQLLIYGHLLMLSWAVTDYSTNRTQTPAACLTCLRHTISAIQYIDTHNERLQDQFVDWFKMGST